jgi:hypothetical protein
VSEKKKLAAAQAISPWTLREMDKLPSEFFRLMEADLIGRLAREAALAGLRFDGWPKVTLVTGPYDYLRLHEPVELRAEVVAK